MSTDNRPLWQKAATNLFGKDWIAPVAEVLGISRRTVERYREEISPVPADIDQMLSTALPDDVDGLVYGSVVRQIANGVPPEELRDRAHEILRAIEKFEALRAKKDDFTVRAYLQGYFAFEKRTELPAPPSR